MITFTSFRPDGRKSAGRPGEANEGEMNFAFIDMGQGDCTIISCPNNDVVVVDCGSAGELPGGSFEAARDLVRDWADGESIYVILTHPDKDHYNKIAELLAGEDPVDVINIHFSLAWSDESPLGNYTESGVNNSMALLGNPDLFELILNTTTHQRKGWSSNTKNYKRLWKTDNIAAAGRVLLEGEGWSVTMIAGNVATVSMDDGVISNTASICTLAQFAGEKLLLTGDATPETMAYLLASHAAQITNVTILQMPHHGSGNSLPTLNFRDAVNPFSIIVSVSQLCDRFHMPTQAVINRWNAGARLRNAPIDLDVEYWVRDVAGYDDTQALNEILDETWKTFEVLNNTSGSFYWLAHPADAVGNTGFYGFTKNFFFLYRQRWPKDIYLTGVMRTYETGFEPDALIGQRHIPSLPPPSTPVSGPRDKEKRL
jgi:beta-lactamase superfamily II metal-dependent hydrolase